jgi:PAS domain S-box-containing protein
MAHRDASGQPEPVSEESEQRLSNPRTSAIGPARGRWDPERSASLLRATLEATADGILVVDLDGNVVTYNQRFLELWQIPADIAEKSHNRYLVDYVQGQLIDSTEFLKTIRENQAHPEGEYFLVLRFKDGRVLERLSRPQRVGTEVIGRVLTFRDVTERQQLLERAQDAVRLRDEFLSIAAHEIRGPITSMRLAVQSLRAGPLPPEAVPQALDIIDRSQRRLADFVDKLLDLGRIQTGALHLDFESLDLSELVREVVGRHHTDLERSGSSVSVRLDGPVVGTWDRLRLDQVVTNLLSNAIKFGAGKPIEVEVNADQATAAVIVRDQGIGIPVEVQQRIFHPFQRGVSIRHYGGLGLGLHIVQTIVDGLRGNISVHSEPGAGATFRVQLPRQRPDSTDGNA